MRRAVGLLRPDALQREGGRRRWHLHRRWRGAHMVADALHHDGGARRRLRAHAAHDVLAGGQVAPLPDAAAAVVVVAAATARPRLVVDRPRRGHASRRHARGVRRARGGRPPTSVASVRLRRLC